MAKFIVVLKSLGSISLGGGISYGGFELYQHLYPKTLGEILEKEGVQLLATENNDDEWEKVWKANKQENRSNFQTLKQWCEIELKKTNNKAAKEQVTEYCSLKGIKNVSQLISYSQKEEIPKNDMKDEDYQLVFLIYTSKFVEKDKSKLSLLDWLEKSNSELTKEKIKSAENLKEKGDYVKKECKKIEDELEKQKDNEEYESIYWWCTKIKNKAFFEANTIEKRVKYVDPNWELTDNWEEVDKTWGKFAFKEEKKDEEAALVKFIEKLVGTNAMENLSNLQSGKEEPDGKEKFKKFCTENKIKNKKLTEDQEEYGSNKNIYMLYKSICKKTSSEN